MNERKSSTIVILKSFDGTSKFQFDTQTQQCKAALLEGDLYWVTMDGVRLRRAREPSAVESSEKSRFSQFGDDYSPHYTKVVDQSDEGVAETASAMSSDSDESHGSSTLSIDIDDGDDGNESDGTDERIDANHEQRPKQPPQRQARHRNLTVYNSRHRVVIPRHLVRFLAPALRYYGGEVPRWYFFAGLQHAHCRIDVKLWQRLAWLTSRWLPIDIDTKNRDRDPEFLGQLVGWLGWMVEYQLDQKWDTESRCWRLSDEFDNPLSQLALGSGRIVGDCEDIAILQSMCFAQLPESLCPLKSQYCLFNVDTVIMHSGLHQCTILVPWAVLRHVWLSHSPVLADKLDSVAPAAQTVRDPYELPVLVIESTDMTMTKFRPSSVVVANAITKSEAKTARATTLADRVHVEVFHRDRFTRDHCFAYPFADVSFVEQGYFDRFLVAYSPQLLELTGVASWQMMHKDTHVLGVTLAELVLRYDVRLVPRQEVSPDELAEARHFMASSVPKPCDLTPRCSVSETEVERQLRSVKKTGKFPVYRFSPPPIVPAGQINEDERWEDLSSCSLSWRPSLWVKYL